MKRVRALLQDLRSGSDDIVCLQEQFDEDVTKYLGTYQIQSILI